MGQKDLKLKNKTGSNYQLHLLHLKNLVTLFDLLFIFM